MLRVIREVEPAWVIGENVPGIIGMELDSVLSDLESEGYSCQAFVLPACAVDAPHRRDRVWVVAYTDRNSESNDSIDEEQRPRELVADSQSKRMERDWSFGVEESQPSCSQRLSGRDSSGGGPRIWQAEPGVGRVANGVSHRVDRLRGLGNAVVPQLIQAIGELVLTADKEMTR